MSLNVEDFQTLQNDKPMEKHLKLAFDEKRDKQNQKCNHSLIKVLENTLSGEMYHAILTLFITPHFSLKLFLLLFLVVSLGLASYTTITLILTYLEYGVTTTVRIIYETPTAFPEITICNVNQFSTRYAFELLQNISQQNQINVLNNFNFINV